MHSSKDRILVRRLEAVCAALGIVSASADDQSLGLLPKVLWLDGRTGQMPANTNILVSAAAKASFVTHGDFLRQLVASESVLPVVTQAWLAIADLSPDRVRLLRWLASRLLAHSGHIPLLGWAPVSVILGQVAGEIEKAWRSLVVQLRLTQELDAEMATLICGVRFAGFDATALRVSCDGLHMVATVSCQASLARIQALTRQFAIGLKRAKAVVCEVGSGNVATIHVVWSCVPQIQAERIVPDLIMIKFNLESSTQIPAKPFDQVGS